jgi:DNA-binding CsgD family transcriptional regulator
MAAVPREDRLDVLIRRCYAGLDAERLRAEVLDRLRGILTVDAVFFATVDPATMLFTSGLADEPLRAMTAEFVANEFGRVDVNKFTELASAANPVSSLDHATRGDRSISPRFREVMAPLGLGDELRAALMAGGRCWGVVCLHREASPTGFTDEELGLVRRLGPHVAEGLRRTVLADHSGGGGDGVPGPGVIVLDAGMTVVSMSPDAEYWLAELPDSGGTELPVAIRAAVARLSYLDDVRVGAVAPVLQLRTRSGRWLAVHTSQLRGPDKHHTAVVLGPATPTQLSSLLLDAHALTPAQQRVTALVLQGRSTKQIVAELHISPYTVQEHLRAAYDKFGVGSRRELIATILAPR